MATITYDVAQYEKADQTYRVLVRLTHKGRAVFMPTEIYVEKIKLTILKRTE